MCRLTPSDNSAHRLFCCSKLASLSRQRRPSVSRRITAALRFALHSAYLYSASIGRRQVEGEKLKRCWLAFRPWNLCWPIRSCTSRQHLLGRAPSTTPADGSLPIYSCYAPTESGYRGCIGVGMLERQSLPNGRLMKALDRDISAWPGIEDLDIEPFQSEPPQRGETDTKHGRPMAATRACSSSRAHEISQRHSRLVQSCWWLFDCLYLL